MIHGFRNEMEFHLENGPAFGNWEYNLNSFTTFNNESMWIKSFIAEDGHSNFFKTIPNITEFDLNNNDVDIYPTTKQEISSTSYRKINFESNHQTSFNDNVFKGHYIKFDPPDSCLSRNFMEQTEPIDLSCGVKKTNSNTAKKPRNQVETTNNFEHKSKISTLPLPGNITQASVLILKNVYDVKYNRKPNCDKIFHEDPVNPKLYVCKVCDKHVRSKWHHFQTHYSRDHKCSDCDAVYSRIDTLRTHAKKRHHTVIPRYYYGIPANVWHRVIVQCRGDPPYPKPPPTPKPIP